MTLIGAFAGLSPTPNQCPRILLSICTGAMFPGNLGIFSQRFCTTHWAAYEELTAYIKAAAVRTSSQPGTVIPARFVDSGVNTNGVRITSSGGISCGMDAGLHVVKLRCGEPEASSTAQLLDYAWRKTEGVVFGDDFSAATP
ncbi:ThiJ/PfpI family protein [Diplogelasinospora grovesii]|uniref:ThiJ/PfpI family protein n=1 Tax=Diplogelasinospora grovesii TaxID=303347 RepID=A0AAN6MVK0_9PEZI|nr:ThiJ/PfpI family protein [Diplogelasinospora grovesii]